MSAELCAGGNGVVQQQQVQLFLALFLMDGRFMYFNFLLYVPVMSLLAFARVYHTFQQCMWGVYLVLAPVSYTHLNYRQ